MPKFKDIFQSFNFRNNKIINAKTNTPTEDEHIVNKSFVDSKTIYNTPKVLEYVNPFKLEWVTNPVNKNILQLFDDVFFPRINPEYFNPTFETFDTKKVSPNIVFIDTINTGFTVSWVIKESDRELNQAPSIVITKNDDSFTTIIVDSISLIGQKSFNVDWSDIKSIEFVAVFNPTENLKQDTYGDDYLSEEFETIYTLKHNILSDIQTDNIIVPALFYRKIKDNENVEDIVDQTLALSTSTQLINNLSYTRTNKNLIVTEGLTNFNVLLVPKIVYDEYLMFIGGDNVPASVLTRNEILTIDGVEYYLNTLDLGYYESQSILEIKFKLKSASLDEMLLENFYLINELSKIDSVYLDISQNLIADKDSEEKIPSAKNVYDFVTSYVKPGNNLTISEIMQLVDNDELIPGNYYIINDFQTIYTIPNTDSSPIINNRKITSYVINTWAVLETGTDNNLTIGKTVTITKLPDNYVGPLMVGQTTTVNNQSSQYYFRFVNGMHSVIGIEFSYITNRFSNGIANNIIVNDVNNKPVIKPGGVTNIEVHDGTVYMDMSAAENLSVPIEQLILRAKSTNEFELEGKSLTYINDVVEYVLPKVGEVSTKGTIIRRYNQLLKIDIKDDWRVKRYRRWKISDTSILRVLNRDIPTSTITFNTGNYQFSGDQVTPTTYSKFYIAQALDSKELTMDTNGKVIEFTMDANTQITAKDFPIFPLDANHNPINLDKFIVSSNFSNTVIQNISSEMNLRTNIDIFDLMNTTVVCSIVILGKFVKIYDSLLLDTLAAQSAQSANIQSVWIQKLKTLCYFYLESVVSSTLSYVIVGNSSSVYAGTTVYSRWVMFKIFDNSSLINVAIGGNTTNYFFNFTNIQDSTLYFHTTWYENLIIYNFARIAFINSNFRRMTILHRSKVSNISFEIVNGINSTPASVTGRDLYINTNPLTEIDIKFNKYSKKLYYTEFNDSDILSINDYATVAP